MINCEISIETKPKLVKFPIAAKSKINNNVIVVFYNSTKGVVICSDDDLLTVGYYSELWNDISSEKFWEILPEGTKIELTQGKIKC